MVFASAVLLKNDITSIWRVEKTYNQRMFDVCLDSDVVGRGALLILPCANSTLGA
jgi:hypothetical protein